MADWLLSFAAGDEGEVGVAIETPRGPVVESLMERGFAVHSINPNPDDSQRVPISVQTQEPPCRTSALPSITCTTTEAPA